MPNTNKSQILLSGGGTGGSVVPLLAISDELGFEEYKYIFGEYYDIFKKTHELNS